MQVTAKTVLYEMKKALTLSSFLKKVTYVKKDLLLFLEDKRFITGLQKLLAKKDYHGASLLMLVKETWQGANLSSVDLAAVYDYMVLLVDEDARERTFTKEEENFIQLYIALYESLLKFESQDHPEEFYLKHSFQFLTKKELEALEDDEYKRFMKAFKEDHIYALMKLSRDLYGFNTLDHVAGVHEVGMFIGRQLKNLGLPLDLGRVSGALAGHDIGKYGVKLSEMRRVPYLHYYYSDLWFKKHGIDYIRNIAVNHSTWDLELENLSLEALILIYSDFRVKNKKTDNVETMHVYPLDESFDVILEKLDNVDDAKKKRYERVYAKLQDFEKYLTGLGVEVALRSREENRKVIDQKKTVRVLKKPAICFGDEIVGRLKYHAIDHNIKVMHLLRNEFSMDTLLEEARSLRDWQEYSGVYQNSGGVLHLSHPRTEAPGGELSSGVSHPSGR